MSEPTPEVSSQPDGIQAEHLDDFRIPAPAAAAERVVAFVRWFGDGIIRQDSPDEPPLYARDLCALACAVLHGYRADGPSRCMHTPPTPAPTDREALPFAPEQRWAMWNEWDAAHPEDTSEYDAFLGGLAAALAARPAPVVACDDAYAEIDGRLRDAAVAIRYDDDEATEFVTLRDALAALDAYADARPAPVVACDDADAEIADSSGLTEEDVDARVAAFAAAMSSVVRVDQAAQLEQAVIQLQALGAWDAEHLTALAEMVEAGATAWQIRVLAQCFPAAPR